MSLLITPNKPNPADAPKARLIGGVIRKNMDYEIKPHVKIGPVKLGMKRQEVKDALGAKKYSGSNGDIDYYFNNSFQIEFDDNKVR